MHQQVQGRLVRPSTRARREKQQHSESQSRNHKIQVFEERQMDPFRRLGPESQAGYSGDVENFVIEMSII